MQASRKNELLIGFTLSVLLSLFVNFSLLMRTYEKGTYRHPIGEGLSPEDYFLYFSLLWFFAFAFFLFVLHSWLYRASEQWFPRKEYKRTVCTVLVSTAGAFGLFCLYPKVHEIVWTGWQQERSERKGERSMESREASSSPINALPFSFNPERPPQPSNGAGTKDQPWRRETGFPFLPGADWPLPFPRPLVTEHLFVLLTVILSVGLMRLLSSKQQMQLQYEQLKTEKLQNSYNALMGQINPHFFFNSLNGLSSLIRSGEQERTVRYLDELSQVFRYILQSNKKELVTLAEELQFVKAYTYLLSVRYEGKLFFSIQAAPDHLLWYLPILSILPLIENAVKHNVISKQYPLQIDIYTTQDNELQVSNKIQPKAEESTGSGIGLKNLWGRYRMLTGKDIQISKRKEYFRVSLPLLPSLPKR